ncbi:hypothetical protein HDF09_004137 [Edaphobacter lichenicola]|uniref:Uncharacterized protein n=1 Tax=Tunturiibacter empetritectus TaxID=3069691 RepID=A0A7W8ILP5_9BACT|nr:hypothetical protein [Edaphobacter lichenicola]
MVTTSHRYEELGVTRQLLSQLLRLGVAEVDADFLHHNQNFRMDA